MDVKLPNLGEGADSGTVVGVLVNVGDMVSEGQTILELENEKAIAPIPAPASGKVAKVLVKEGQKLSVGQVILTLEGDGAAAPKEPAPASAAKPTAAPVVPVNTAPASIPVIPQGVPLYQPIETGLPPAAAPSIRKMARDLGIDLHRIRGSERGGRIVMKDLYDYIQYLQAIAFSPKPVAEAAPGVPAKPAPESIDFSKWGAVESEPVTPLRRTIARRMVESWTTIPHVTQYDESDITDLMALRKKYKDDYAEKGANLTVTPFALKAVVKALQLHPVFNSSWDEVKEEIVHKQYYHIGLAVDTEAGLLVPVIRDVDKKSILELSLEIEELANKARERKLALDEMKGGTFTISNQGGIGGGPFTPIINKPEVAILGMARGVNKPVVVGKEIKARLILPLSLSYDHRIIDGGTAARFITDLGKAFTEFTDEDVKLPKK